MSPAASDPELGALMEQIAAIRGFRCDAYKQSCLRRRVAVRMRACGVHTYRDYGERLSADAAEYDRLLEALTINVTKFYRNAETWDRLRAGFLPELLAAGSGVRAWSAGCASGEEPYTLAAVLLDEAGAATGSPPPCIDATDLDRGSLDRATTGIYREQAFEEMPASLKTTFFPDAADGRRTAGTAVRSLVRFIPHDITQAPPPRPPYDLIMFRNVAIYFDRPTQDRIFRGMADALATGGLLVLGKVETLFGAARDVLKLEDVRERIYRRA